MTDAAKPENWEPWMDNPLQVDQAEGTVVEEDPTYVMQTKTPFGAWEPWSNPRTSREEVTRIQAYHLRQDPQDTGLRVWTRNVTWTLDEVPGQEEGQTPPEEILARNDAISQRPSTEKDTQQPE